MAVTKKVRKGGQTKSEAVKARIPTAQEVNQPPSRLEDYIICLYGEKGIGKTTLVSQFKDSLVFMWEPGRRNLKIRQYPYQGSPPLTYRIQKDLMRQACEDPSVKLIGIDTIDRLYSTAVKDLCYDRGINDPGEMNDFGAFWREIRDDVEQLLLMPRQHDKGLILVSHAKEKEFTTASGNEYSRVVPTAMNAAFEILKAICDYAFYYGYSGKQRMLQLRGDDHIWSACGVDESFMDAATNKAIDQLILPNDPKLAFQVVQKAFSNTYTVTSVVAEKKLKPKKKTVAV